MLNNLYKNIGEKIKGWAKWVFIVGAISAVISGMSMLATAEGNGAMVEGVLTLVLGPLVAWVSSWLLYALGQITDDIHAMRNKTCPRAEAKFENSPINGEEQLLVAANAEENLVYQQKIARIAELRKKGLISEEMYQSAINNPSILEKF